MRTKVILASTSPRRIDLMKQARIQVKVVSPDCEELQHVGESPISMVTRLAREKAKSVAMNLGRLKGPVVVIAADTIVVAPNKKNVLGKPKNSSDAEKMLQTISGKTHEVLTGYCLMGWSKPGVIRESCRVVRSQVSMRKLSKKMIREYVASGEPLDKAGSYAAQGFGMNWILSLRGSYTNVVGLPMCELLIDLEKKFGVRPSADAIRNARRGR
ncbi:MAG: septum formation protein Maf [Bdellovibrionales bacterium]|nr:septum formation protein Maf [Bdellovibrionales bacterium]